MHALFGDLDYIDCEVDEGSRRNSRILNPESFLPNSSTYFPNLYDVSFSSTNKACIIVNCSKSDRNISENGFQKPSVSSLPSCQTLNRVSSESIKCSDPPSLNNSIHSQSTTHVEIEWEHLIDLYCDRLLCDPNSVEKEFHDTNGVTSDPDLPESPEVTPFLTYVWQSSPAPESTKLPESHDRCTQSRQKSLTNNHVQDLVIAIPTEDSSLNAKHFLPESTHDLKISTENHHEKPLCLVQASPSPTDSGGSNNSLHISVKESSKRLANRLYYLQGFQPQDVPIHLCRRNEFSDHVLNEYTKLYPFQGHTVDVALRQWIRRCPFLGELLERERLLQIFVDRYFECNPNSFKDKDSCITLACAILLLNTDLHGNVSSLNNKSRLSQEDFVNKLLVSNHGSDYSGEQLSMTYQRISKDPIMSPNSHLLAGMFDVPARMNGSLGNSPIPATIQYNPLTDVPSVTNPKDFLHGFLLRKQTKEGACRRVPLGKRGWKLFFVRLCGLELQFYRECGKRPQVNSNPGSPTNNSTPPVAIPPGMCLVGLTRIDHCHIERANNYHKRPHVFLLRTRLGAEYLFQVGSEKEVSTWIEMINFVSALLAVPPTHDNECPTDAPTNTSGYTWLNIIQQTEAYQKFLEQAQVLADDSTTASAAYRSQIQRYQHYLLLLQDEVRALRAYFANRPIVTQTFTEGTNNYANTNFSSSPSSSHAQSPRNVSPNNPNVPGHGKGSPSAIHANYSARRFLSTIPQRVCHEVSEEEEEEHLSE